MSAKEISAKEISVRFHRSIGRLTFPLYFSEEQSLRVPHTVSGIRARSDLSAKHKEMILGRNAEELMRL